MWQFLFSIPHNRLSVPEVYSHHYHLHFTHTQAGSLTDNLWMIRLFSNVRLKRDINFKLTVSISFEVVIVVTVGVYRTEPVSCIFSPCSSFPLLLLPLYSPGLRLLHLLLLDFMAGYRPAIRCMPPPTAQEYLELILLLINQILWIMYFPMIIPYF